jgi:hypothetical protein
MMRTRSARTAKRTVRIRPWTEREIAGLGPAVGSVLGEDESGIVEHFGGEVEGHAVLREVLSSLSRIPLELHHRTIVGGS